MDIPKSTVSPWSSPLTSPVHASSLLPIPQPEPHTSFVSAIGLAVWHVASALGPCRNSGPTTVWGIPGNWSFLRGGLSPTGVMLGTVCQTPGSSPQYSEGKLLPWCLFLLFFRPGESRPLGQHMALWSYLALLLAGLQVEVRALGQVPEPSGSMGHSHPGSRESANSLGPSEPGLILMWCPLCTFSNLSLLSSCEGQSG